MDPSAQILHLRIPGSRHARRRGTPKRRRVALLFAVLATTAVVAMDAGAAASATGAGGPAAPSFPPNQTVPLDYRAWNGALRHAVVLLPAGYSVSDQAPLPCVIAAHGRDMPPTVVAQRWGSLPTDLRFAVVCADSAGVNQAYNSWAAPGQLRDLMRLPALVERAAPWVRLDRRRIFAVGVSMGAQEVLCLAARYPDRLAGVAAFDGVTDLAARYGEVLLSARGGPGVLRQMRQEMGGTPQQVPFSYRLRSPRTYAATLATAGVPLQLWWSPRDVRVINQATTQTGALYRRISRLGPAPHVVQVETQLAHGVAFSAGKGFEPMLAGFRPNGEWLASAAAPPERWTYVGAAREAHFWGYGVRLARAPVSPWRVDLIGAGEALVDSRDALQLTVPCPGAPREIAVTVNGRRQIVVSAAGAYTVCVPAGKTTVLMEPALEQVP